MSVDQALRVSSILLAASGFLALVLAGAVPYGLLLLGFAAILAGLLRAAGRGGHWKIFHLSRTAWASLILVALPGRTPGTLGLWANLDGGPALLAGSAAAGSARRNR